MKKIKKKYSNIILYAVAALVFAFSVFTNYETKKVNAYYEDENVIPWANTYLIAQEDMGAFDTMLVIAEANLIINSENNINVGIENYNAYNETYLKVSELTNNLYFEFENVIEDSVIFWIVYDDEYSTNIIDIIWCGISQGASGKYYFQDLFVINNNTNNGYVDDADLTLCEYEDSYPNSANCYFQIHSEGLEGINGINPLEFKMQDFGICGNSSGYSNNKSEFILTGFYYAEDGFGDFENWEESTEETQEYGNNFIYLYNNNITQGFFINFETISDDNVLFTNDYDLIKNNDDWIARIFFFERYFSNSASFDLEGWNFTEAEGTISDTEFLKPFCVWTNYKTPTPPPEPPTPPEPQKTVFEKIGDFLVNIWNSIYTPIFNAVDGLVQSITDTFVGIVNYWGEGLSSIGQSLQNFFGSGADLISNFFNAIGRSFESWGRVWKNFEPPTPEQIENATKTVSAIVIGIISLLVILIIVSIIRRISGNKEG